MAQEPNPRWVWQQPEWPHFRWDAAALSEPLARARRAQGELAGAARLLDSKLDLTAQLEVLTLDGVNTSAIEGEKLDPNALRSSIARRLGLPAAGLPAPTLSIEGLVDVLLDATRHHATPLTLKRLCGWQAALFPTGRSGLHEIRVGQLRGKEPMQIVSGPIGRERVHYKAPPRQRLRSEMNEFVRWFNERSDRAKHGALPMDGLLRAGLAHVWFEILHPFEDGNGRVGRAVLDMALAQDEQRSTRLYSLSARFMQERDAYYDALEKTSSGTLDVTPWLAWFLEQVAAATHSSESIVSAVLWKARFWLKHSHHEFNERQLKVLNRMLDVGPGGFEGGMTNRKYASLTSSSSATTQRDLADLTSKGVFMPAGSGRSVRYEIAVDTRAPAME